MKKILFSLGLITALSACSIKAQQGFQAVGAC
ncbi:lipoprotein [Limnohabitans sp.]|jgi:hypothetical protein